MRRSAAITFGASLPCELTKLLPIGGGMFLEERGQRVVAFFDQPIAPFFGVMQRGGIHPRELAIVLEFRADRFKFFIVEAAQLLGEELDLPLAGDLLRHAPRAANFIEKIIVEREVR